MIEQVNRYTINRLRDLDALHLMQVSKCHLAQSSHMPFHPCIFHDRRNIEPFIGIHYMGYGNLMLVLIMYTIENTVNLELSNHWTLNTC